ncbi:hypothetical protein D3C72_2399250 [compost metagenome]
MLDTSSGRAMRFSCLYRPGAMKPQTWCRITGMARNSATTMVSLNGVRKGEATSVAIMVAPSGRYWRSGAETRV